MLKVEGLNKTFESDGQKVTAVKDVSFEVGKGEIYGLIGLSGAGKSTLIRCLNLLERPDSGKIFFDGSEITAMSETELILVRKKMAMIFQHFNLFWQKTVFENVAFPLMLEKSREIDGEKRVKPGRDYIKKRVRELLDFVGLADRENDYPAVLSGGQKQRVAIARALALKPKLILSDEGTSALDPETTQNILALIRDSVKNFDMSAVLITHQMEVAKSICDRIAVMEGGGIVEENRTQELFLNPRHSRTRKFIESLGIFSEENNSALPGEVLEKGPFYRLGFKMNVAFKPVISTISRKFDLDCNIISGNINNLNDEKIGHLEISFDGEEENVSACLKWLKDNGIIVEEVLL